MTIANKRIYKMNEAVDGKNKHYRQGNWKSKKRKKEENKRRKNKKERNIYKKTKKETQKSTL